MQEPLQLFDALPDDEYEALKASIAEKGLLVPITKDQHGRILDGHHRERACRELGIEPRYEVQYCADDSERKVRALVMNLLRRHLTREQKARAVAELRRLGYTFERIAAETGIPETTARRLTTENEDLTTESEDVRQMADVETYSNQPSHIVDSRGRVQPARKPRKPQPGLTVVQARNTKDAERASQALAVLGEAAPARTLDVKRAERIAREKAAEERRAQPVEPVTVTGGIDIRHGDFRDVLADLEPGSVDAIITAPPYPKEYIPLFGDLGKLAARILKPTGILAVMTGQSWLREYLTELDQHMRYRWVGAYIVQGPRNRVHAARVGTGWKPILIYSHPDAGDDLPFILDDLFDSAGDDKRHHHWGQSESGIADLVERLTHPGALVCDPFLGGGTTAVVCKRLGRRFVGCDIDAAHVATSRERVT